MVDVVFPLTGEPVALDLVNTRARVGGVVADLLESPAALTGWLSLHVASLPEPADDAVDDQLLTRVRILRDASGALLAAQRQHADPPSRAIDVLNAALATPPQPARLAWDGDGPRQDSPPPTADDLIRALAGHVLTLLTGPDADLVRTCAHPDCVLLFLARNPRRRWCSPSGCGNRARVARHHARTHQEPRP